jgi:hypothetical protein
MNKFDRTIMLASEVATLRARLTTAENELRSLLGEGVQAHEVVEDDGPQVEDANVTTRVKRLLATGRRMTFGEMFTAVLKGGPATKFAVRSALSKGRERGTIQYDGEVYFMSAPPERKKATESPPVAKPS